jgi:hypothetical protein
MIGVWTYPWSVVDPNRPGSSEELREIGVTDISLATHYHSVRALEPRGGDDLFVTQQGGWYGRTTTFPETPIDPIRNEIAEIENPIESAVSAAAEQGIETHSWTVLLHNSRLATRNPEYRIQDAFGNAHEHALCPANEAVREYARALTGELCDYGVDSIELESIGYPSVFHGHGHRFGHDKRQTLESKTGEWLFSQCFCQGCQKAADSYGIDITAGKDRVQKILRRLLEDPGAQPPTIQTAVASYEELRDLFWFRSKVIDDYLDAIRNGANDVQITCYTRGPSDNWHGWQSGVTIPILERQVDRIKPLCYVDDPKTASEWLEYYDQNVDCTLDAGITMDPQIIEDKDQFEAIVDTVRDTVDGKLTVYNYSLMTKEHLDWIRSSSK